MMRTTLEVMGAPNRKRSDETPQGSSSGTRRYTHSTIVLDIPVTPMSTISDVHKVFGLRDQRLAESASPTSIAKRHRNNSSVGRGLHVDANVCSNSRANGRHPPGRESDDTDVESSPVLTRDSFFNNSTRTSATSISPQNAGSRPWIQHCQQSPSSATFPPRESGPANRRIKSRTTLPETSPAFQFPSSRNQSRSMPLVRSVSAAAVSSTTDPTRHLGSINVSGTPGYPEIIPVETSSPEPVISGEDFPPIVQRGEESPTCPRDAYPRGPFAIDLECEIIAHDNHIQKLFDSMQIAYGVQYELARGVSNNWWKWSDVTREKLRLLTGDNASAAYKVVSLMQNLDVSQVKHSPSSLAIWQELDREQLAITENLSRGLGLYGEWEGSPNWYGGRIQQVARLEEDSPKDTYRVRLEPLEMRSSNRFARFMGSRRILHLRVARKFIFNACEKVRSFLQQKFVLCGRVFVPFHAKDSVYMVETNEDYERQANPSCGDQHRMSFGDFVRWHNSFERNWDQPISKWTTRWALGVSTSIPVLEFEGENMFYIEDIYSEDWSGPGSPPAEKVMTDGCGFMNGAALVMISKNRNLPNRPTAVQGRIAGAKGVWILHPSDKDPSEPPRIWIRRSQRKIDLGPFSGLERAHRIFDLVAPSRTNTPARLSIQVILNLDFNGVPAEAFESLMQAELQTEVKKLTDWSRPNAMAFLWSAINRAGNVSSVRVQRQALGAGRALGLTGRNYERDDDETDGDDEDPFDDSSYSGHNCYSGRPLTLHESALELVQSGFHPAENPLLYGKIREILGRVTERLVKKFHYPVARSVRAFMVPDPFGVLNEGEIFFRSSEPLTDPDTNDCFNTLSGDVIVGRTPMCVPSDMRKVKAVNCPQLISYYDVAVFPVKGDRSLQSWLSGGDSDGDEALIIWEPSFTNVFSNANMTPRAREFETDNFDREIVSVVDFGRSLEKMACRKAQQECQSMLLLGLADRAHLGQYSKFHDVSVYAYGYGDERTIRLAHMFETLLDAAKSGLRLNKEVFKRDRRNYDHAPPSSMQEADHSCFGGRNDIPLRRNEELGVFILDKLVEAGAIEQERHLQNYDQLGKSAKVCDSEKLDPDLTGPYKAAQSRAEAVADSCPSLRQEIKAIEEHVLSVRKDWTRIGSGWAHNGRQKANDLARKFAGGVEHVLITSNVDEIKASFASTLGATFAFAMAFRELCAIKARAKGQGPVTQGLLETMRIPTSSLRALAQNTDF